MHGRHGTRIRLARRTLIATYGAGWVQRQGGSVEDIRPGDVIWFAAGEKHWHGATASTAMSHIAIAESWMAKLWTGWRRPTDEQYNPKRLQHFEAE